MTGQSDAVEPIVRHVGRLRIDAAFVLEWSAQYVDSQSLAERGQERVLFQEVGPRAGSRGYFSKPEILMIGEWKAPRARSRLARNPPSTIERVTRAALSIGDERLGVLLSLEGVGSPVASAILSVWQPELYTVYDYRAVQTLKRAGAFPGVRKYPSYGLYLDECRRLASSLRLADDVRPHLRTLDRALWKYSQQRLS